MRTGHHQLNLMPYKPTLEMKNPAEAGLRLDIQPDAWRRAGVAIVPHALLLTIRRGLSVAREPVH